VRDNLPRWTFKRNAKGDDLGAGSKVTYTFQLKGSCDHHKGCKEELWHEPADKVLVVSELPKLNTEESARK